MSYKRTTSEVEVIKTEKVDVDEYTCNVCGTVATTERKQKEPILGKFPDGWVFVFVKHEGKNVSKSARDLDSHVCPDCALERLPELFQAGEKEK